MTPNPRMLRPFERQVRRLVEGGMDHAEVGRRFRRQPDTIGRVMAFTELPRMGSPLRGDVLTPVERRILRWRETGASHEDIAPKFGRTPRFTIQVERLAHHKLGRT